MTRRTVANAILVLTSLVFAAPYASAIWSGFVGTRDIANQLIYGVDAFVSVLCFSAAFMVVIPVIPVCLVYNIALFVVRKRSGSLKSFDKRVFALNLALVLIVIVVALATMIPEFA